MPAAKWIVERSKWSQFRASLTKVFPGELSVRQHDVEMDEEAILALAAQLLIEREAILRVQDPANTSKVILFEVIPDAGTFRVSGWDEQKP